MSETAGSAPKNLRSIHEFSEVSDLLLVRRDLAGKGSFKVADP